MQDNDGTPLTKKAETISYYDIYSTPDDRARVSVGKAYAEGAQYVDDPTITEKGTKSFTQQVKDKFAKSKEQLQNKVKQEVTYNNAKVLGRRVYKSAIKVGNTFLSNVPQPQPQSQIAKNNINKPKGVNTNVNSNKIIFKTNQHNIDFNGIDKLFEEPKQVKSKQRFVSDIDFNKISDGFDNYKIKKVKLHPMKENKFERIDVTFKSPKQLKGNKIKLSNMKEIDFDRIEVNFNRKKKGGLF